MGNRHWTLPKGRRAQLPLSAPIPPSVVNFTKEGKGTEDPGVSSLEGKTNEGTTTDGSRDERRLAMARHDEREGEGRGQGERKEAVERRAKTCGFRKPRNARDRAVVARTRPAEGDGNTFQGIVTCSTFYGATSRFFSLNAQKERPSWQSCNSIRP